MMMLHELLREWGGKGTGCDAIGLAEDYYNVEWTNEAFEKMADEIESTYIPLPTDVRGNPWCEGDECEVIFSGKYGLISGYRSDQVLVSFPEGHYLWYYPHEIKRIEKDTLGRIDDDATKSPFMYCVEHRLELSDATDLEESVTVMIRDLLKRQRDVLERDHA